MAYPVPLSHHAEHFGWRGNRGPNDSPVHEDDRVTYSVPSTERLLNAKHFSRLPPKSVARQEALWQDTLREGSVRALCQGREYNSSGLTCHLKEAVRARNSVEIRNRKSEVGPGAREPSAGGATWVSWLGLPGWD